MLMALQCGRGFFGAVVRGMSIACLAFASQAATGQGVGIALPFDSTAEFEVRAGVVVEAAAEWAPDPVISAVLGGDAERSHATRFVIGRAPLAGYKISSLINPNRVVVDLDSAEVELPAPVGDTPAGLIKSFRAGISATGKTRVVIDTVSPVVVTHVLEETTVGVRRLLIDLVRTSRPDELASVEDAADLDTPSNATEDSAQPPIPKRTTRREIDAQHIFKPTIVIDPGHGGMDTGAMKFGTIEKEVVLAFGQRLKAKLHETGRYKVLLTRETDVFVELDERRVFAERNKAALFIAIHADSANTGARGATVYSLRHSVADDMKHSAKDEARKDVLSGTEIKSINSGHADVDAVRGFLTDLAQREVEVNRDRTNVFTRSIIEYMGRSTSLKDNPDRTAQFRVLKTVRMPAVLIELAYVSNEEDASNLRSDVWRDKVTQSIVTAIESYFAQNISSLPL